MGMYILSQWKWALELASKIFVGRKEVKLFTKREKFSEGIDIAIVRIPHYKSDGGMVADMFVRPVHLSKYNELYLTKMLSEGD